MEHPRQPPTLAGWHTKHEWADRLGKCIRTISAYMTQGLKYSKIRGTVLIHEDDFENFLRQHSRGGNLH